MPSPAISRLSKALNAATHDGDVKELLALAERAGVNGRLARRAARGIAINADAYLKLCSAVWIDPVKGTYLSATAITIEPLPDLDWNRVAIKVLLALIGEPGTKKLPIRDAAKKWRIPVVTLSRAKSEQPIGIDNLLKLCRALNCHPHDFLKRTPGMFHAEQSPEHIEKIEASA